MKLLLENWRLYVESRKNAWDILDSIPRWSIVKKGDGLFRFTGTSFIPLDHIDIGSLDGTPERSARDWAGGVIHMKRSEMLDYLEEDPDWIKVVLDPTQARQIAAQFKSLRDKIMKDYKDRGVSGAPFTDEFKRDHPVSIDLNSLNVILK